MKRVGLFLVLIVLGCSENHSKEKIINYPGSAFVDFRFRIENKKPGTVAKIAGYTLSVGSSDTNRFSMNLEAKTGYSSYFRTRLGKMAVILNFFNGQNAIVNYLDDSFILVPDMQQYEEVLFSDNMLRITVEYTSVASNIDSALVCYFNFNNLPKDRSSFGNDLFLFRTSLSNDRFENPRAALQFPETRAFALIPYNPDFELDASVSSYSLSFWFYAKKPDKTNIFILATVKDRIDVDTPYGFEIGLIPPKKLQFSIGIRRFDINAGNLNLNANISDLWQRWIHVAAMYDVRESVARLYIDAKLHKEAFYEFESSTKSHFPVILGTLKNYVNDHSFENPFFVGRIDDFRIYNRSLLPQEVEKLYSEGQMPMFRPNAER
jgi:hypothetical protein